MKVHLLDGTYELFRHYYGAKAGARASSDSGTGDPTHAPPAPTPADPEEEEVAASRGVVWSVVNLLEGGVTHIGVATDHVIESFRNRLWPGYKTSAGVPADLLQQFPLLEEALTALGVVVWPMVDLEADDALAAAATTAAADPRVEQVVIMTPDKDLSQCVSGQRVVQVDRRKDVTIDEDAVRERYGIAPESIPDWLALVGDSADGFPGLPGWGKGAASTVLARYPHIDVIPDDWKTWDVTMRSRARVGMALADGRELANLFRDLATLRSQAPVLDDVEQLRWRGPAAGLPDMARRLRAPRLVERVDDLASRAAASGN